MKTTLMLVTTHRGISDDTWESIFRTECPNVLKVKGQACIDRARSIAFDQAYAQLKINGDLDMVLCIDDDMVFKPNDACRVVDSARRDGIATSAVAVNSAGLVTHKVYGDRFVTGLAFIAIPRKLFIAVGASLQRCGPTRIWCRNGPHPEFPDQWIGEDYDLCVKLGGVLVHEGVSVGHVKEKILWP